MADTRTSKVILQWAIDKPSVQALLANMDRVRDGIKDVQGEVWKTADTAAILSRELGVLARAKGIDQIADDFARARQEGVDLDTALVGVVARLNEIGATEDEIKGVAAALERAANAPAPGRNKSVDTAGNAGSFFSAIAGLNSLGGGATSNLLGEVGQIGDIIQAVSRLPPALGIAGAAAAGLTVLVGKLSEEYDNQAQPIRTLIGLQEDYFRLVLTGSKSDLEGALEAARVDAQIAELRIQQNRDILAEAERQINPYGTGLGNIATEFSRLTNAGGFRELEEAVGASEKALAAANQEINLYTGALEGNVGALKTEQEAFLRTSDIIRDQQIAAAERTAQSVQNSVQAQIGVLGQLDTLTMDSLNRQISLIQATNAVLIKSLPALTLQGTEAAQALVNQTFAQIDANNAQIAALAAVTDQVKANDGLRAATELATTGIHSFTDGLLGIPKALGNAKPVLKALQDVRNEEARHATAIADIRGNLADKEAQILTDAAEKEAQIFTDGREKAADLARKFQYAALDGEEDYRESLLRISKRYGLEQLNAIGDRDAAAFDKSKNAAALQEDETERHNEKEKRRRNRDYDTQLQDIVKATARQLQTTRAASDKQLQLAKNAADKQIELEYRKNAAELEARNQALQAAQRSFSAFVNGALGSQEMVLSGTTSFISSMIAQLGRLGGTSTGGIGTGSGTVGFTPSAAAPPELRYQTARPRPIVVSSGAGAGTLTIPITINGIGLNRRQVIREVDEYLYAAMTEKGFQ